MNYEINISHRAAVESVRNYPEVSTEITTPETEVLYLVINNMSLIIKALECTTNHELADELKFRYREIDDAGGVEYWNAMP